MPHFPTPHSRYQHMFVVVRLPKEDRRSSEGPPNEGDVTLTKAFLTETAAQEEAGRMNDLNGAHWIYFVNVVRLVDETMNSD